MVNDYYRPLGARDPKESLQNRSRGPGNAHGQGGRTSLDLFDRQLSRSGDRPRDKHPRALDGARPSPTTKPGPSASSSARNDAASERGNPVPNSNHRSVDKGQLSAASGRVSPASHKPQSGSSTKGPLLTDIKTVTELLCDRVFWSLKREHATERLKKLQFDADRCKGNHSDYGSALETIGLQKEKAEQDRKKCCSRVEAADERLYSAVYQAMARNHRSVKPTPDGEPKERAGPDIASRLSTALTSIEASSIKALAEQSLLAVKSFRTQSESKTAELNAQTAELKAELRIERKRNDLLEKKVDELVRKLDAPSESGHRESAQASQAQTSQQTINSVAKFEEAKKDLVTRDELAKALQELDDKISSAGDSAGKGQQDVQVTAAGDKTARKLRSVVEDIASLEAGIRSQDNIQLSLCLEELRREIDAHDDTIKSQADQYTQAKSAIKAMQSSVARLSADLLKSEQTLVKSEQGKSEGDAVNISDDHIQQVSRMQVETMLTEFTKGFLPMIVQKVQGFLNEERGKREAVADQAENSILNASMLRADLDDLRQKYAKTLEELNNQTVHQVTELASEKQRVVAVESALAATRTETKKEMDELAMQMCTVQAWQNNFTTRPLYRDIVEYINATLPSGVSTRLRNLTARIEGIESQLDTSAAKRRKLQHDGLAAANGSH